MPHDWNSLTTFLSDNSRKNQDRLRRLGRSAQGIPEGGAWMGKKRGAGKKFS
jgi:hypothetical protein